MKIPKGVNVILTAITICGVSVVSVSCKPWLHSGPRSEIYEITDPESNLPVVRFVNTQCTDGRTEDYYGTIKFRQSDGSVISIFLLSNDPNWWTAKYCKPGAVAEEISINRIYDSRLSPRNLYDKCWVEEGESWVEERD